MPAWAIARRLARHFATRACSRARLSVGKRIATRSPMMAMTTSSSISVKARGEPSVGRAGEPGADAPLGSLGLVRSSARS